MIEFTCPNRGLLEIAGEPPPSLTVSPIHTIYVQARGLALVNKESATLGGATSNTDLLHQSTILAKVPVVYSTVSNPQEFVQFYAPTERATSVHLPSPHLGDMMLVLVDHLGRELSTLGSIKDGAREYPWVDGYAPVRGESAGWFSMALRVDIVRVRPEVEVIADPSGASRLFETLRRSVGEPVPNPRLSKKSTWDDTIDSIVYKGSIKKRVLHHLSNIPLSISLCSSSAP